MSNNYRCGNWAAVVVFLLAAGNAGALVFKTPISDPSLAYSPNSIAQTTTTVSISNERYSGPFCVVFTELSLLPAPLPEGLRYGLYQPAASPAYELALDGIPANSNELLVGNFPSSAAGKRTSIDLKFAVLVSPGSLPPPGNYSATIKASLYASSYPPSGKVQDTDVFTVSVSVPSCLDLSLIPEGSPFSLSSTAGSLAFGTIVPLDMRSVDLLVRSNVGYSLSILSINGGSLANADDGSLLLYSLAVNGLSKTLQPGIAAFVTAGSAATWSIHARYRFSVTIKPFAELPTEGQYSDTIMATVTAP